MEDVRIRKAWDSTLTLGAAPATLPSSGDSPTRKPKSLMPSQVKHGETGSCFDRTRTSAEIPGAHWRSEVVIDPTAFRGPHAKPIERPDPKKYLRSHSGTGGNAATIMRSGKRDFERTRDLAARSPTRGGKAVNSSTFSAASIAATTRKIGGLVKDVETAASAKDAEDSKHGRKKRA